MILWKKVVDDWWNNPSDQNRVNGHKNNERIKTAIMVNTSATNAFLTQNHKIS